MILLALLVLAPVSTAQAPVVVAVADFVDDTVDGSRIGADRLSADLAQTLARVAGGRMRVVPVDDVRAVMRARSLRPADLVSPTRTQEVAQAVGAQWVITGRWHALEMDVEVIILPNDTRRVQAHAWATLQIRVFDAATRRVVLEDSFSGMSGGGSGSFMLRLAAREALRRAALRLARL